MLWRIGFSILRGYEPKSFIEVGSEHSPINLISRWNSLDTNVDDLATTLDASGVCDITDVGRWTSPLFSQYREVSAVPFSVSSCSHTHLNHREIQAGCWAALKLRGIVVES